MLAFCEQGMRGRIMPRMKKSTFTPLYAVFRKKLVSMRKAAGLTQRDLAKRLKREHSFVARIEQGERRLDVVEFYWVCRACGVPPDKTASEIMRGIMSQDTSKRGS